jgi:shikimate dehydrogenase
MEVDHYGLIGGKLSHSFSAAWFTKKFKAEGIQATYANYELKTADEVLRLIQEIKFLRGLNVTIPFKIDVIPFLDKLDVSAQETGAVNTIKITEINSEKFLTGFNTDTLAFEETIQPLLKKNHQKALILGTGGAALAVRSALQRLKMESIMVSRSKKNHSIIYSEIDQKIMRQYSVIINCTPEGMFPAVENMPALPVQYLTSAHLVYDLIYNPEETLLLKKAAAAGAATKNGLDMLHRQAELAWEIWNGSSY